MNNKEKYIQFGCGLSAPLSWENFDNSPSLRLQRVPFLGTFLLSKMPQFPPHVRFGDVVVGLPISNNSINAVYSSHVLEHLALSELRLALSNVYRYLVPNGIFRFVFPDLEYLAHTYLTNIESDAAHQFMEQTMLGKKVRDKSLEGLLRSYFGGSAHLWLWDYKAIKYELEKSGFRNVRRAYFNDSAEKRFLDVEDFGRWENCLGIECQK